jgi:cytochrome c-type biogenesis protein CcmE
LIRIGVGRILTDVTGGFRRRSHPTGADVMSKKATRAVVSAVVLAATFVVLLVVTMRGNTQYYKHVDEVMPQAHEWYGKGLQLHGFVVDGSIMRRPNTLDYQFKVQNGDSVVLASYTGVVPDTFKGGAEVVMKGRLSPEAFHADEIMAKCPSKYEEEGAK